MDFKKISVQGKAASTGTETLRSFLEKLAEIGSIRSLNIYLWKNAWLSPWHDWGIPVLQWMGNESHPGGQTWRKHKVLRATKDTHACSREVFKGKKSSFCTFCTHITPFVSVLFSFFSYMFRNRLPIYNIMALENGCHPFFLGVGVVLWLGRVPSFIVPFLMA